MGPLAKPWVGADKVKSPDKPPQISIEDLARAVE